jgi:hypothetical protein
VPPLTTISFPIWSFRKFIGIFYPHGTANKIAPNGPEGATLILLDFMHMLS